MKRSGLKKLLAIALLLWCGDAISTPLRVVSTPNPNVFPLLLAMSENPGLPVTLVPVATGNDIVNAFSSGLGDALLSMTYAAAQDVVTGKVPRL
ncbi:MAG TPA: hypothetical protein PLK99_02590, partial [Burkholderiales bacterium]|nr:hypothetical protein [Burkholderiales bacterium]